MVQNDPVTHAKGPEHIAAYEWMQDYAQSVIEERRAHPQNDLISHFSPRPRSTVTGSTSARCC